MVKRTKPDPKYIDALEATIAEAFTDHGQDMDPLFVAAMTMDLLDRQSLSTLAELVAIRIESRAYEAFQLDMAATLYDAIEGQTDRFFSEVQTNLDAMCDRRLTPPASENGPEGEGPEAEDENGWVLDTDGGDL